MVICLPVFLKALFSDAKYELDYIIRPQTIPQQNHSQNAESPSTETINDSLPNTAKEITENLLFPSKKSKKNSRCNLCHQKIPDSWMPSKHWVSYYKRMSKIISQTPEPPKKKFKTLAPPSSESSDQSDTEHIEHTERNTKQAKNQQHFLDILSDQSEDLQLSS